MKGVFGYDSAQLNRAEHFLHGDARFCTYASLSFRDAVSLFQPFGRGKPRATDWLKTCFSRLVMRSLEEELVAGARALARQFAALAPPAVEAAADAYCEQSQKRSEMLLLQLRRNVRELDEHW